MAAVAEKPFLKWGAQSHVKKTMENFFIKRFTLTMDPNTYLSKILNVKVRVRIPRKNGGVVNSNARPYFTIFTSLCWVL